MRPCGICAGINIDPSTASKADGEKLGSIMMYNMISGAGTDAHEEGTPESLAAKQDVQTLLGAANSQQLPLHFTRKGDQVRLWTCILTLAFALAQQCNSRCCNLACCLHMLKGPRCSTWHRRRRAQVHVTLGCQQSADQV
jgi:hypothetical protein